MSSPDAFSVRRALRDLQTAKTAALAAADKASAEARTPTKAPPAPSSTTYDQAMKTEHVGSEGERAFGAPMDRQHTDRANPTGAQ